MWRSYLTATLRHVARNPLTTFLNTFGLALGFATALLALLYVIHETTFDRFIPGYRNIYVVVAHSALKGQGTHIDEQTPAYLAGWLRSDFPDLHTVRLMPSELTVRQGQTESEERAGWADPDFFSMLRVATVAGDPVSALREPDSLVITRRMARKYFGRDTPLGETLELDGKPFQIAAVIADLPAATHLGPEIFGSALNRDFGLQRFDAVPWPVNARMPVITYLRLPEESHPSVAVLQKAMPAFVRRHMSRLFELMQSQYSIDMQLVRLDRLHLYPNNAAAMKPHGRPPLVVAIGITGLLVLLVAVINFVNLVTAHSARRAVEIGVRKVCGAGRFELVSQFIGESLLYAYTAMCIAMALVHAVLPAVDSKLVSGMAEQWLSADVLVLAVSLAAVTGVLGGLYPALVLSAYQPADALRGGMHAFGSGRARQYLVALQFSVLIALVVTTLVMLRQTTFSLRDGLRFPQDQLLIIYTPCPTSFTERLRSLPGVSGAACAGGDPAHFGPGSVTVAIRADGTHVNMGIGGVGFGAFEVFGVSPLAGRLYDPVRDAAAAEDDNLRIVILNESAARAIGFASPAAAIGQSVASIQNQGGPPSEVIGVVPDFTFDLQGTHIGPAIYVPRARFVGRGAVMNVKLDGQNVPETLEAIDVLWKRLGEPRPIRRLFMAQHLQEQYVATIRQIYVASCLALLSIVIAAVGLFGLSALTAGQRTREIGIRKAMGATRADILTLLLWQFTKPVLWASIVAWPLAYFAMRRWLEGFANHIDMEPWMFLAASGLAVAIALLTVMGHAMLVSRARPVAALRYE